MSRKWTTNTKKGKQSN